MRVYDMDTSKQPRRVLCPAPRRTFCNPRLRFAFLCAAAVLEGAAVVVSEAAVVGLGSALVGPAFSWGAVRLRMLIFWVCEITWQDSWVV